MAALLASASLTTLTCAQAPVLEEVPLSPDAPRLPWIAGTDLAKTAEPLFRLSADPAGSADVGPGATGWAAVTAEHFLLRVEVRDPVHFNPHRGGQLWQGDCLQIGLDARGDTTGGLPRHTRGAFGPDDAALGLALTPDGAEGFAFFRGEGAPTGPLPAGTVEITRDEGRGLTDYQLRLPWSYLGVTPGLYPEMGLAVQWNDSAPGREQQRFYFGRGADGEPAPGLMTRLRLAPAPGPFAAGELLDGVLWAPGGQAEVRLALHPDQPWSVVCETDHPAGSGRWEIAPGATPRYRRLRAGGVGATHLRVTVGPAAEPTRWAADYPLVDADQVRRAVEDRLDQLLATSPHPLFTDHLQSVKSLVAVEWARLGLYWRSNAREARATLQRLRAMELGLQHDAGRWESYLDGRRSLILAYSSPHDQTVQYYHCGLPRDWDPARPYPLFFELHGAGDPNPLNGVAAEMGIEPDAPDRHGYDSPKVFAEIQRHGYWCQPFGRGNLGYRGIAEIDVLEAYDDFHRRFPIDPDRRYLYGFSMGGGGTWSFGLRTPDRWAALAVFAGGLWREPAGVGLARNAVGLPIRLWCGEEDSLFPFFGAMRQELREAGIEPVVSTTPGLGHNYRMDIQEEILNWLQTHTRRPRPAEFFFVADTDQLRGAWGITLDRHPAYSGAPSFTCRVRGQEVYLHSQGTPSLEVIPGEGGLGLSGEFTLFWNGAEVYRGPVQPLRLQAGAAQPFVPGSESRRVRR